MSGAAVSRRPAVVPLAALAAIGALVVGSAAALADDAGAGGRDGGADAGTSAAQREEADAGAEIDEQMDDVLAEAMRKIAQERNAEAKRLLRNKSYPLALIRFREAHDLDPDDAEITNNLGYIYYLLGNYEEAERLYRRAIQIDPERAVAYINLADLLVSRGSSREDHEEAARLLVRARELRGNKPSLILRQARVAVRRGAFEEAERFYREYLSRRRPSDELRLEIGDFYRDLGRSEEALDWYRQIDDEELGRRAAGRIWEIEVERQTRRFGWTRRADVISPKARSLTARGRALLGRGDYEEAEHLLREAISLAPGFAEARAHLGDLLRETGRAAEAELEYLRALAVEHADAEIHARLGELYLERPAGEGRAAEAALFLTRALDLRPDWVELHLDLARALRAAGDFPGALRHVERYLAGMPRDRNRADALALKRTLEDLVPPERRGPSSAEEVSGSDDVSEELAEALGRARAHLARGETDAAMAELRRLGEEERGTGVLNLEGRILFGAGRLEEAVETWRESLRADEGQAVVHEQLGVALLRMGETDRARIHLVRAAELGSVDSEYHLAALAAGVGEAGPLSWPADVRRIDELLDARVRLAGFLARGSGSVYRKDAEALLQRVEQRLFAVAVAAAGLLVLLLAAIAVVAVKIWGGADLRALIRRHPEAGPEVQRVLSAVRHEVLKHNTMMLSGLVEAIREDSPDAAAKAAHFRRSLLGGGGERGVAERLDDYLDQLRRIGRANRVRLNLRRRDPVVAPLLGGFRQLRRIAPGLERLDQLSPGARAALLRSLRSASHLLNTEAYQAVLGLLDRLRAVEVDEELLRGIFERCRREPAFSEARVAPPEISIRGEGPCGVTVPRAALEDILSNLVRNALQSSLENDREARIGLDAEREVDAVTGLERVVFAVRDRAREQVTAEMLRGRYIEEGLGLTADLVSRYDGTLDVVPGGEGWSKAVLVKLPLAEIATGEEESG